MILNLSSSCTNYRRTFYFPDVDVEGILKLMRKNFVRNSAYSKSKVLIKELDFLNLQWPTFVHKRIDEATVILAADGKL